jgi:hypothetical protein
LTEIRTIPSSCLSRILEDFTSLIQKSTDPNTDPREWIGGCVPEHNQAYLPWESELDELELDPIKRLDGGEELAIRLHSPYVGEAIMLIDGKEYIPANQDDNYEGIVDSKEDEFLNDFPSEMNFFAIGIKRDGSNLQIRPVCIYQSINPGGVAHRSDVVDFPKTFESRIEQYLSSLVD